MYTLGVFGTFPIKVATKAPVEEPMLQPSKLAPLSSSSHPSESSDLTMEGSVRGVAHSYTSRLYYNIGS